MLALKAWRDTLAHKGQFIALIVLVSLGIMSFVTFQNGYYDLKASLDTAYSRLRFADITVSVQRAPLTAARDIRGIAGVADARVRTVQDVGLELGDGRQATARIVSLPDSPNTEVNAVVIQEGAFPAPGARADVLLHPKFATDTKTGVGDTLTLRIAGERKRVRVAGIATDPEYMYPLRTPGDLPSPGDFAVLYMPQHGVESLLGNVGSGNDIAVRATPGINLERLSDQLEDELDAYGVQETVLRKDKPGYDALQAELDQNRVMARSMPLLVLAISSMSLFIALSRLVTAQRGEIGLAKALGYSDGQILGHYLSYALIIGAGGSVLGVLLGLLGARGTAASYVSLLGLPFLTSGFYPGVAAIAVGIALVSCVLAALMPALNSARLAPAIAMHADPNKSLAGGRIPLVERLFGKLMPTSFTFRVPVRNVFRARRRSLYTVLGIAFAMILSVVTVAMFDSIDYLLDQTFEKVERWDVTAIFEVPVGEARIAEVRRLKGVNRVQAALVVPITVSYRGAEENVTLTVMRPEADFHGFSDARGADPVDALRAGDLVLPAAVASKLGIGTGSRVEVESPLGDDPVLLSVGSLSEETLGQPSYLSIEAASELLGGPVNTFNALYIDVEPALADRIQDEIYDMPGAASVQVKAGLVERLKSLLELFNVFGAILLFFGSALAFVVVFTTFTANVTERTREIATMRTIGEDNLRLTMMITMENILIALAALPLGIWLGIQTTNAMFATFVTDSYTLKAYIYPESVARICLLMIVVILLSEIPPVRRIFRLDLAEATKVME